MYNTFSWLRTRYEDNADTLKYNIIVYTILLQGIQYFSDEMKREYNIIILICK